VKVVADTSPIHYLILIDQTVDAVRELWQYAADHDDSKLKSISLADQKADVLIEIDRDTDGRLVLTVIDKGIGMTAATVRDYFLKAGASLRTSDEWLREFAPQGHSKVVRSGRFGIGNNIPGSVARQQPDS
jgi:molecular chaperone HtpG